MTPHDTHALVEQLAAYGYPLMRPVRRSDPETVLERLLRQRESRIVEGFAVVLLNALREKTNLRWESPNWNPEKALGVMRSQRLARLLALSYVLFRLFGLEKSLQERARTLLFKCKNGEDTLRNVESHFLKSEPLAMNGFELSTERLKNTFRTYYVNAREGVEDREKTHALEFELLLSELFTPRQKELLRKRAEGAEMTNTEKTYFYRTVSKRLKALANEEVHELARRLLRR
ncbi:MAG: hypothetical protein HY737_04425 [Candidatus Omnitrophica bacterium]|nr:hypothetical protein [Candidatus Omnitrophota bacterium]